MIQGISVGPVTQPLTKEQEVASLDLFHIGMHTFLRQLQETLQKVWEGFRENQSDIREQKESGERSRLEGNLHYKATSQEGTRNFHERGYLSSGTRHLNLPA